MNENQCLNAPDWLSLLADGGTGLEESDAQVWTQGEIE